MRENPGNNDVNIDYLDLWCKHLSLNPSDYAVQAVWRNMTDKTMPFHNGISQRLCYKALEELVRFAEQQDFIWMGYFMGGIKSEIINYLGHWRRGDKATLERFSRYLIILQIKKFW